MMVYKFFIAKNITKKMDSRDLLILLDQDYDLYCVNKLSDAKSKFESLFDRELEIGLVAYRDDEETIFFANALIAIVDGWDFVKFGSLDKNNCSDYEKISLMIKKLGYCNVDENF